MKVMTNHRLANLNKREIREADRHQIGLEIKAVDAIMSKLIYIFIFVVTFVVICIYMYAGY